MRLVLLLLPVVLLDLIRLGLSARILAVFPFPGKSHDIFFSSIIKCLVEKGHQVVEYSPFPPAKPIPNHSHVEVHTLFEKEQKDWTYEEFRQISSDSLSFVGFISIWFMNYGVCEDTLRNEKIQQLLNSEEHFDMVFVESTFGQESLTVFGDKFKAPVVVLQAFNLWSGLNMAAGNDLSIASIPEFPSLPKSERMTFLERMTNLWSTTVTLVLYYLYHLPRHDALIRKYYRQDGPPLVDMVGNISLYLVNTHPAAGYPQPYTPNIVPISGITVSPERIPLPQDLKKFMDEAKDGVIYFSLGTVVPVHTFPKDILQMFVNVFKRLKQKVVWKLQTNVPLEFPKNVLVTKWVPQPGVLAHPNCVLFLTHGGLFSQQEALHAGVPTVGIPFFGDQPYNMRFSEHRGIGIKLDFNTLSEDTVATALNTVLNNPSYRENAQRMSRIFRDRPVSPADSVVFWTEYVLRHAGAHHLRPASTQLTWYQLTLLDVLVAVLFSTITVIVLLYVITRIVLAFLCGKKETKQVSTSKKKK